MWLRIVGALLVTVGVLAALEYFGVGWMLGGRSGEEVNQAAQSRSREFFWSLIFAVVMATAVLAAVRRWAGHLRRAGAVVQPLRRRDVA